MTARSRIDDGYAETVQFKSITDAVERFRRDGVLLLYARVEPDRAPFAQLAQWLTQGECHRAQRFRFAADRDSFVLAHALLRRALGWVIGDRPIAIASTELGKPMLADRSTCVADISLAHCRQAVSCALVATGQVGIDVEPLPALNGDLEPLAQTIMSSDEYSRFRGLAPADRAPSFASCWTLKEAVTKALGLGLNADFQAFAATGGRVVANGHDPDGVNARRWTVATWNDGNVHGAVALADSASAAPVSVLHFDPAMPLGR